MYQNSARETQFPFIYKTYIKIPDLARKTRIWFVNSDRILGSSQRSNNARWQLNSPYTKSGEYNANNLLARTKTKCWLCVVSSRRAVVKNTTWLTMIHILRARNRRVELAYKPQFAFRQNVFFLLVPPPARSIRDVVIMMCAVCRWTICICFFAPCFLRSLHRIRGV